MSRELTQQERAAMWLYHSEYAAQTKGAIEFYADLSKYAKDTVDRMLEELKLKEQDD